MLGSSLQWMPDQKTLLVKLVPEQCRAAAGGCGRRGRPEHPGDRRPDRREQHVRDARHADEQARRGSLRLLRDAASSRSSTRDRRGRRALGKPGDHHRRRRRARRRAHPRRRRSASRTRTSRRTTLRARRRGLGPRRHADAHARVAAARRSRADRTACPTGPRDFEWRPTEPATLVWAEALDGGDWNVKVPARDKVMMQTRAVHRRRRSRSRAPSSASPASTGREQPRRRAAPRVRREPPLAAHVPRRRRRTRRPSRASLWDLSSDEHYKRPRPAGLPRAAERRSGSCGRTATRSSCAATGASPDGDRPFLDRARSQDAQVRAAVPQRQERARVVPRVHRPDATRRS